MIEQTVRTKPARQHLLEATRTALARDGFEGITTRRIAEAAGVNIATLHYHFGSKEALLAEAVRFTLTTVAQQTFAAMQDAPSLRDALQAGFQAFWSIVRDQPGTIRLELTVRGFRDETARLIAAEIHDTLTKSLEGLFDRLAPERRLEPRLPLQRIARYMVSTMDGILLTFYATRDEEKALEEFVLLRDHVLYLLGETEVGR
ncbi:MAG: TetR/AcrR family transcriptional regulator [Armatimonadota bacterium]